MSVYLVFALLFVFRFTDHKILWLALGVGLVAATTFKGQECHSMLYPLYPGLETVTRDTDLEPE